MAIKSFYSFAKLFSFGGTYNHAVGGRGIGKTYGAKKKVTKDAIKTSFVNGYYTPGVCDQFIYLRRYKEELSLAKSTFFADYQHEFPDWDFRVQGWEAQTAHSSTRDEKKRAWDTIGFFISLSTAQSYKSVSFPRVKTIIFDEYILEKSATPYLPNEYVIFDNFFSTVDRYKDKTRVLFLANSVSIANPYFIALELDPDTADENGFVKLNKNDDGTYFDVIHFIDDDDFKNEVYETKFGRRIQGSQYADYAVANKFRDNHKMMIGDKTSRAKYMFTLETSNFKFSVWFDMVTGIYYMDSKFPKGEEKIITTDPSKMDDGKLLMTFSDKPLSMLRTAYRQGRVVFKKPALRNAFLEVFKR